MTYQHLTAEIDRCKETAQAFKNYKNGDCTFDDFVTFAMENNTANSKHAREYFESLRDKEFVGGSNSALAGLMDYDAIYDSVIASNGVMDEMEADQIYSFGSRYFSNAKATLVA